MYSFHFPRGSLLTDPTRVPVFLSCFSQYEAGFHAPTIGYDAATGLTWDGRNYDPDHGQFDPSGPRPQSAPSKESIHVALLALALHGHPVAVNFVQNSPEFEQRKFTSVDAFAVDLLQRKLAAYTQFRQTYPGYAGFMPWFVSNVNGTGKVEPTWDWKTRVPSLDNGEWIWSMFAAAHVLLERGYLSLGNEYMGLLAYQAKFAVMLFYNGSGMVRAEASIKDIYAAPTPDNYWNQNDYFLDDPYEGELFVWFADLFGKWPSQADREQVWINKRAKLQSVQYISSEGPITVQVCIHVCCVCCVCCFCCVCCVCLCHASKNVSAPWLTLRCAPDAAWILVLCA